MAGACCEPYGFCCELSGFRSEVCGFCHEECAGLAPSCAGLTWWGRVLRRCLVMDNHAITLGVQQQHEQELAGNSVEEDKEEVERLYDERLQVHAPTVAPPNGRRGCVGTDTWALRNACRSSGASS
eukprot:2285304-Rhodomonas_salina.2